MPNKIPTLEELMQSVYAAIEQQKKELADKIEANRKKMDSNVAKSAELDKKEAELVEREKVVAQKEKDVEFRWSKLRRDDEVQNQYNEVLVDREKVKKDRKEITDLIAENNFKLEQIKKKELEMCDREATYKEKIEKELTKKIIGLN